MYHQGESSSLNSSCPSGNSSYGLEFINVTHPRSHSAWVPAQGQTWQFPTAMMQSDREAAERSWILFYDTKLRKERERLAVGAALELQRSRQQQQQIEGYQKSSPFSLQPVSPNRQPKPIALKPTASYYKEDPRVLAAAHKSTVIYQQISNAKSSVASKQNNPSALDELFVPRKRCLCKDFIKTGKCEAIEQQEMVIYESQIAEGHWQYHWGTFTSSSLSSFEPSSRI